MYVISHFFRLQKKRSEAHCFSFCSIKDVHGSRRRQEESFKSRVITIKKLNSSLGILILSAFFLFLHHSTCSTGFLNSLRIDKMKFDRGKKKRIERLLTRWMRSRLFMHVLAFYHTAAKAIGKNINKNLTVLLGGLGGGAVDTISKKFLRWNMEHLSPYIFLYSVSDKHDTFNKVC